MPEVAHYEAYRGLPDDAKGAVIALGNFDGLHRGHQIVMKAARTIANEHNLQAAIGVFMPHPIRLFKPDSPPFRVMSAALRRRLLPTYGMDAIYEIPFDTELRGMTDAAFVETVLHKGLGARHIIVGEDFRFGVNRCGDFESLTRLCAERGIEVSGIAPVGIHKIYGKYGSTQVREALQKGDVFHAAHILSRPWIVDGIVEKGQQKGRTIGFPTANLSLGNLIRPKYGVYTVELTLRETSTTYRGVANVGVRPTVGGEDARLEVHIFDFNEDIYGQTVDVAFRTFIRSERKFESFEALKMQIREDSLGARAIFGM